MRVLNMAVPLASEGVAVADNWDVLGMRGTASDDVVLTDVFVPQERVLADRPYGVIDPPLQVIASIGFSIISGAYLGVAEAAYAEALRVGARQPRRPDRAAGDRPDAPAAAGRRVGARRAP